MNAKSSILIHSTPHCTCILHSFTSTLSHMNGFYLQERSGDITRKEFNAYVVKNMSQTDILDTFENVLPLSK